MSDTLAILDALPAPAEVYGRYWNVRPFLARDAIGDTVLDRLIAPEELAALAMEDTARSRLVSGADWSCRFGPFSEDDFAADLDGFPWSRLVQNVDQFHPPTADLLRAFGFAPRWLVDDIMVSFSTAGGGIGGHVDSYHVFLVQGAGRRRWTVGHTPVQDEVYVDGLDLKILKHPVDGDTVEVGPGDVLYVPPRYAHEGTTLEDALTFSVGFLGPTSSDMRADFDVHPADGSAAQPDDAPTYEDGDRYIGAGLTTDSAGFVLAPAAAADLCNRLGVTTDTPDVDTWLASYLTGSTSDDPSHGAAREDVLSPADFVAALRVAGGVIKPAYVKVALVPSTDPSSDAACLLGVNRLAFSVREDAVPVVQALMTEDPVTLADMPALAGDTDLLCALYNAQAVELLDRPK